MKEKKFLLTGGTGLIGSCLTNILLREGHYVTIITRSPKKYAEKQAVNRTFVGWDDNLSGVMAKQDVVINLAGENLFGQRWSDEVKKRIYDSRIQTTNQLVSAMDKAEKKPTLFISASAVGIYGDKGNTIVDESSEPGDDFLANVCIDWEKASHKAKKNNIRVANPRIGIVLDGNGGVVEKMLLPFKLFVGGPVGSGNQYVPWVHIRDLCNAILYPIKDETIDGPYNACSPTPETMGVLAQEIGKVLNRPSLFRVPEFVLKTILGEAAEPVMSSLRVHPKILQKSRFQFEFEDLEEALADIL